MKQFKKGVLEKNNDGLWFVKWSDLSSFSQGTHWSYNELSSEVDCIQFIEDNIVKNKPLTELEVVYYDVETIGYDENTFIPLTKTILKFPEVDEFIEEELIKEYVKNGGVLFSITDITRIRDGGTLLLYNRALKSTTFYIHKDNWTLHDDYPTNDTNLVTDKPTQTYILSLLERHVKNCEFELKQSLDVIKNIKL